MERAKTLISTMLFKIVMQTTKTGTDKCKAGLYATLIINLMKGVFMSDFKPIKVVYEGVHAIEDLGSGVYEISRKINFHELIYIIEDKLRENNISIRNDIGEFKNINEVLEDITKSNMNSESLSQISSLLSVRKVRKIWDVLSFKGEDA